MNRYDFNQPGGFPFDQGVMAFIQDNITTAQQLAALCGPLAILSGCVVAGGSVGNGWIAINGEILPFTGGLIEDKVVINEDATTVIFQDDTPKVVKYVRGAGFGDDGGATNYLWTNFQRNTPAGALARIAALEAEVDALNTDIATLGAEITDLETNKVTKLASGSTHLGDADSAPGDSGTIRTVAIGKTLANNNYMVLFTIVSNSVDPHTDVFRAPTIRAKTNNSFDVYFSEVNDVVQDITLDWVIIAF